MSTNDAPTCAPLTHATITTDDATAIVPLLKALADPTRLRLVSLIAAAPNREANVCALHASFPHTQATISHHLKTLHTAGALHRTKRGKWVYYSINPTALPRLTHLFTPCQD